MSKEDAVRFMARVSADESLQAQLDGLTESGLEELGIEQGFDSGDELDDDDLDAVSGGLTFANKFTPSAITNKVAWSRPPSWVVARLEQNMAWFHKKIFKV